MKLKINKYEFDVTDKDWILDNGACYQCMTLKHYSPSASMSSGYKVNTIMSKAQFRQLVKENKLVQFTNEKLGQNYIDCKFWRFNVEENNNDNQRNYTII